MVEDLREQALTVRGHVQHDHQGVREVAGKWLADLEQGPDPTGGGADADDAEGRCIQGGHALETVRPIAASHAGLAPRRQRSCGQTSHTRLARAAAAGPRWRGRADPLAPGQVRVMADVESAELEFVVSDVARGVDAWMRFPLAS